MTKITDKYKFVQNTTEKWTGIGLTKLAGKYQGVVFQFGKVSFGEKENADGRLPLHFQWKLLDSNGLPKDFFGEEFYNLMGDILCDVIDNQLEEGKLQYVNTDN